MIPRLLSKALRKEARRYPVLTLTGPRQSGKTTLARDVFPRHAYVSLEEPDARSFARDDPRGFLARFPGPVIFDEAQRVPDLFSYLQPIVDDDPAPGRFILTGSQNFLLMERISQSLAGRTAILHLLPFSRAELDRTAQADPSSSRPLFGNRKTKLDPWRALQTGFYPAIHDRKIPAGAWLADYVRTYIERDVRSLVNIGDLERFERFVRLCAGRVGQIVNTSSIASDGGISVDTARRWLSILAASFVIFLLSPHHRNFNKRLIKSPKLYFHDTGLACYLLGIRDAAHLHDHPLRGALFENLIIAEVGKAYWNHRRVPPIHFWRDRTGHEVDLVIEEGAELHPVEIKSGSTISTGVFSGLEWFVRIAGAAAGRATLVYSGNEGYERSGMSIRPWFAV